MLTFNRMLGIICACQLVCQGVSNAQISVTFPAPRIVFQRNNASLGTVCIAGRCPANTTQIKARVLARQGGVSTDWVSIDTAPDNGVFQGKIPDVVAGWYDLQVAAYRQDTLLSQTTVERIGVGEVLVTAGQSNSWGGFHAEGYAADERVSIIRAPGLQADGAGVIDERTLSLTGAAATSSVSGETVGMAPGAPLFMWGALGDRLTQRLDVPVLLLGASHPGTRSTDWHAAATGTENIGNGYYINNAPYRSLGVAILHYLKRTGVRAVLWHQGEGDNYYRTRQEYTDQIGAVIQKSRDQLGFGTLGWVIARVSYLPGSLGDPYTNHETDPNIIDAQNTLAAQPNNWPGPETDSMIYPQYRTADSTRIHFGAVDCVPLADVWSQSLSADFFSTVQPALPTRLVLLTTGYVFPFSPAPGQVVDVPYVSAVPTRPDNQYQVDLLAENGCALACLGSSTSNPVSAVIPDWANGRYRLRIRATSRAWVAVHPTRYQLSFRTGPTGVTGFGSEPPRRRW